MSAQNTQQKLQYRLVAGLGNPGDKYAMTRHNSGFEVIDCLAASLGVNYWKDQDGCKVAIVKLCGQEVILAKPQAFMNRSGGPLSHLMRRYEIAPEQILVVHDELDLPAGTIRLKRSGGHGGHNGLRSITDAIGNQYARVRIGIGRPPGRMDVADYVLQQLHKQQAEDWQATCAVGAEIVEYTLREGLDKAMQKYHTEQ